MSNEELNTWNIKAQFRNLMLLQFLKKIDILLTLHIKLAVQLGKLGIYKVKIKFYLMLSSTL